MSEDAPCLICGHIPCPCCVNACDLLSHPPKDEDDSYYCCDGVCVYTEEDLRAVPHDDLIDRIKEAAGYRAYWRKESKTRTIADEFEGISEWDEEKLAVVSDAIEQDTATWWLHGLIDELNGDPANCQSPEFEVGASRIEFQANYKAYKIGQALGCRLKKKEDLIQNKLSVISEIDTVYRSTSTNHRFMSKGPAYKMEAKERIKSKCNCEPAEHLPSGGFWPGFVCRYHAMDKRKFSELVYRLGRFLEITDDTKRNYTNVR